MTEPLRKPFGLNAFRAFIRLMLRLLTRIDISGQQHLIDEGPGVLSINHVSWIDVVIVGAISRGPTASFSAEKWEGVPFISWLLDYFGNAIYVQRGEVDRKALQKALAWLKNGGILGLAPEGTRSYDGILHQAHDGVAWLVCRSDATLVPIAIWGHENVIGEWKRLRRPRISVRIGEAYRLPPQASKAKSRDLEQYTNLIMTRIAALLPPERRGYYA